MTLQEKLHAKLQPHTDRINEGNNDDFDYLPAVLLHLLEEQKLQSQSTKKDIDGIISLVIQTSSHVQGQIDEIKNLISQSHKVVEDKIVLSNQIAADNLPAVTNLINQLNDDVTGEITRLVSQSQTEVQEKIVQSYRVSVENLQRLVNLVNQSKGEIQSEIAGKLTQTHSDIQRDIACKLTQTQNDLQNSIDGTFNLTSNEMKTAVKLVNQIRGDVKKDAEAAQVELKALIASEIQKTRRLLVAGLLFGVVILGLAIMLYVRH